jgi:hypothetical protein
MEAKMNVYFSDYFNVLPEQLEKYGALNISLINDLPLFIDPFLLFESKKEEYQNLHKSILEYVSFLRDMSAEIEITDGLLKSWFMFKEVKQNWFGYCEFGNEGSGLERDFAIALKNNLNTIFNNFGDEQVTRSSHLEKLCIIKSGVGRDNISDFTVNLIKEFLCNYTEIFAQKYINKSMRKKISVERVKFDYSTKRWKPCTFDLPYINDDFVLLTPKDILTKDENWINSSDIIRDFKDIANSIPNDQLRDTINLYFIQNLPELNRKKKRHTNKEIAEAITRVIRKFPEILDYYIKYKEDNGERATSISKEKVEFAENIFIQRISGFINDLCSITSFYDLPYDSYTNSLKRVLFLKQVIENNDGYKIFYINGEPIKREKDLQLMFRLTWFATDFDVNSEVNNGRGPVDYKISKGSKDKTLVEFKLASNTKLKNNLLHQVEVYKEASRTDNDIKVIMYFTDQEEHKVTEILNDLSLHNKENIILIDARIKVSASNVK